MAGTSALGEFLAARRARLRPADVGVTALGNRRRVPGLRRDEVAQLAGVSTSYYSRLEQGSSRSASPAVLAAVGRALALNPEEQQHLRRLAEAGRGSPRSRSVPAAVSPATRELLAALGHVPALVQDRRTDVLAWNELGHAVLAPHLDPGAPDAEADRPNLARLVFSPAGRTLYGDWRRRAAAVVAGLRQAAGQDPHDAVLAALVAELRADAGFARLWDEHDLRACEATAYELHHPVAGTLVLTQHSLGVARTTEQTLLVLVPAPGSATERALLAGRAGAWAGRRIGPANRPPFGPARTATRP